METLKFRLALLGWRSISDFIYLIFKNLWPYRRRVVIKNLTDCFPVFSENEIKVLAGRYFRHLADLLVEPFLIGHLKSGHFEKLVSYENLELIGQLVREKKDVVLMASHYGNWEYLLSLPLITDCNVLAAYSPLSNKFLNRVLLKMRGRFGVKLVPKAEWYRTALKWNSQEATIFITIADQRPAGQAKNCLEFMNLETNIQSGAARIATHRNCAVLYLDAQKKSRNRYDFSFKSLTDDAGNLDESEIMRRYYSALEDTIRRQPELWLWSHNRWKSNLKTKNYN